MNIRIGELTIKDEQKLPSTTLLELLKKEIKEMKKPKFESGYLKAKFG